MAACSDLSGCWAISEGIHERLGRERERGRQRSAGERRGCGGRGARPCIAIRTTVCVSTCHVPPPPAVWNITTVSLWPPAMSSLSRSRLPRLQLPLTTWRAPPSVFPLMGFERAACLNHLVSLYDPSNLITVYKKKVLIILSVHTKKSWDILDILREVVNNPATCFVFVGIDSPLLILLIRSLLNQLCSDGFFFVCVPEVEHRSPEWLCYPSKCHVCATVLKFDARVWSGRWGGGLFGLITSVFERIFFFFCHEVVLNIIQGLALGKHEGTVLKHRGDQNPVCLLYHSAEHKVPFQHSTL